MKKFKSILLIDDDKLNTYLHKHLLTKMEVCEQIVCIHDSQEALAYLMQHYTPTIQSQPGHDLIFLDVMMPEMDGYEFLRRLEEMDLDHSRFSIVLLTSSPYKKDRQKAATLGDRIEGYLVKPLEHNSINILVEEIL